MNLRDLTAPDTVLGSATASILGLATKAAVLNMDSLLVRFFLQGLATVFWGLVAAIAIAYARRALGFDKDKGED